MARSIFLQSTRNYCFKALCCHYVCKNYKLHFINAVLTSIKYVGLNLLFTIFLFCQVLGQNISELSPQSFTWQPWFLPKILLKTCWLGSFCISRLLYLSSQMWNWKVFYRSNGGNLLRNFTLYFTYFILACVISIYPRRKIFMLTSYKH